jgi:dTDP-4-dehydrorhamnose reductase
MKFLITGSSGLIGSQIVKDLINQNHIVYSCYHNDLPFDGIPVQLDLTNQSNIVQVIEEIMPDRIIHLAALTDVELCETNQDLAMEINSNATMYLAKQAAKHNIFFVYVSTDYVFNGINGMKKENDLPDPLNFYGKSKLKGETLLTNVESKWCIARTSTPFGIHSTKNNFPLWVIKNLNMKKEISVLIDQFTSPTYVPNLSKMLIEIAMKQIDGIIHISGATRISRYDFAKLIADKLNFDKKLIIPTKMSQMDWKATRPSDSSLDVSFATKILNEKPYKIDQSLELFLSKL